MLLTSESINNKKAVNRMNLECKKLFLFFIGIFFQKRCSLWCAEICLHEYSLLYIPQRKFVYAVKNPYHLTTRELLFRLSRRGITEVRGH